MRCLRRPNGVSERMAIPKPSSSRLPGIRPFDYTPIVTVRGGVVRNVIAKVFYSTGARQIVSASVILVEQLSDTDLPNTAAMDNDEHGIALCSGFDRNGSG